MSKITAEGIIGKYKGIKVYKTILPIYVNSRLYKDEENMYLIDGDIIYKNEIFAKYDGKYVTEYDPHERATYYTIPKFEFKMEDRGVDFSSSLGNDEGDTVSNSETKTEVTVVSSNFQPKDVETTLAGVFDSEAIKGVYETDYFSNMMDIDAFLKSEV